MTRAFGLKILVQKWWRVFGPFGCKITGTLDFLVHVLYLGSNVCQQRGITMICFGFICFLHARHLLTVYKKDRLLFTLWHVLQYVMHYTSQNNTIATVSARKFSSYYPIVM